MHPVNSRLIHLAERRALLAAKAESQRQELARAFVPWQGPLRLADQGADAIRFVGRHKIVVVAALGIVIALRPKLAFGWMRKGLLVWRIARTVRRHLHG